MKRDELVKRLMGIFLDELDEHVASWHDALLALERGGASDERAALLNTLFRIAHSLKGASRSVDLVVLENTCHGLETLLSAVRSGERELDPVLLAGLRAAGDALGDAGRALRHGAPLDERALLEVVRRAELGLGATPPPPAPVRAALTPEVSAVAAPPEPSAGTSVLRVPAAKLDALVARGSELRVAHSACERLRGEADAVRRGVHERQRGWREVHTSLTRGLRSGASVAASASGEALLRIPQRRLALLLEQRDWLARLEATLEQFSRALDTGVDQLGQLVGALDDEIRALRLVPFALACAGLERSVRELAADTGRELRLELEGDELAIDRGVAEAMRDPLLQLVRNAVAHGIEPPTERLAAGKPAAGTVRVAARLRGARLEVEIRDDGRGVDLDALAEAARRSGREVPTSAAELLALVFEPGVSTTQSVTRLSGRGVGLDIVRSRLDTIHATLGLSSLPGQGTRFTITAPLTLSLLEALLIEVAGACFALPLDAVERVLEVTPEVRVRTAGRETMQLGGEAVAVVSLAAVLGLERTAAARERASPGLVLRGGERRVVCLVDALLDEREVVVSPLGPRLPHVRHFAAATILADGAVVPILRVSDVLRSAASLFAETRADNAANRAEQARQAPRLLVADDSLTTRSMMRAILEHAGYQVTIAVDGADAWRHLTREGAAFDLVVSDVEMPSVDGLELARRIRATPSLARLPVILVTGLASDAQRQAGLEAGATAYVTKSSFDQSRLLELIERNL